jgi:hypothetical protein
MLVAVAALIRQRICEWKQIWVDEPSYSLQSASAIAASNQSVYVTIDKHKPVQVTIQFVGGRTRVVFTDIVCCQKLGAGCRTELECRKHVH